MRRHAPALVWTAALALGACTGRDDAQAARGRALFEGDVALTARLVGHDQPLPVQATRCLNCHGAADDGVVGAAAAAGSAAARAAANTGWSAPLARTAPPLDRARLTQAQSRRGGPASAYDAAALCRLLRTGVDPAQVLLPAVMPRYDISDEQCAELWSALSRP
jgi:hypothetical protein